ncbi:deoxycytidylate deaminase [Rubellimicrobium arenae]|nr:deaminase [Rubellimicrobium arenae]
MIKSTSSTSERWDKRFLGLCDHIAGWSEERGRRVGAVIVGDGNVILSTGYNGLPRGISGDIEDRHNRVTGEKYFWFEHAERNAIYNAARTGVPLAGSAIYSNLFPCADCMRAIIQSGISTLITYERPANEVNFAASMEVSIRLIREAGLALRLVPLTRPSSTPR